MPALLSRRSRTAALICTAVLAVLATPVTARAAEKCVVPDISWGITAAEQDRTADAMRDLGVQWARVNVNWHWMDSDPSVLEYTDRAIDKTIASGAKVIIMLDRTPEWASGSTKSTAPPLDPQDYADFLETLVARWGDKVDAWEIWNEQNHAGFWATGPDAAKYAKLLKAAHGVVKAHDPTAPVLFGGMAGSDHHFLERALDAEPDLGDYFDGVALHPYTAYAVSPDDVWNDWSGRIDISAFTGYRSVRDLLVERGLDRKIWITEFGWASSTATGWLSGVDEQTQAAFMTRAFEILEQDPYVEVACWYIIRNHFWANDADTWDDQLGLMRTDFSPKPAYAAFKAYRAPGTPDDPPAEEPPAEDPPVVDPPVEAPTVQPTLDDAREDAPTERSSGGISAFRSAFEPGMGLRVKLGASADGHRRVVLRGSAMGARRLQVRIATGGRVVVRRVTRSGRRGAFRATISLPAGRRYRVTVKPIGRKAEMRRAAKTFKT